MAVKHVDLPGIGPVTLVKSARSKAIRLSVKPGQIRVTLPRWTPYMLGMQFAQQHAEWIKKQQQERPVQILEEERKIGKLHTLHFVQTPRTSHLRTTVTPTRVLVPYHPHELPAGQAVQQRAEKAIIKALKKESAMLITPRLQRLAAQHGHSYAAVAYKQLTRRWGSCDSHTNLIFNCYLIQLSWEQIDYVICHELAHTKYMNHSPTFWRELTRMMPDARMIAKKVRSIQPGLLQTRS